METLMVVPADSGSSELVVDRLNRAVAAHLGRYKGQSRDHSGSDLRSYLIWCAERRLDPLAVGRVHVELWIRWMQEIRRLQPATVSRRVSVVAGFYRTCVIDGVLDASPAEHIRRPRVSTESPTLGPTHLRFEALLTPARLSPNRNDSALVTMLGLLGLRIFEACGANITDLGEEHGHRVLRVRGKGDKTVLVPLPPAVGRAIETARGSRDTGPILRSRRDSDATRPRRTGVRRHVCRRLLRPQPRSAPPRPAHCDHRPVWGHRAYPRRRREGLVR
jgi:integrase